ncbi:MAG TPA: glycosyltransferase family 9 protein [Salinisphaeraceae bacterium]|nr:glycosyltransferase family 9 protein [Salinisphaeraceae bacterium]
MSKSDAQLSGWRALVKRLRRRGRKRLNQLLCRLTGTPRAKPNKLVGNTRRILIVRPNKRLGNTLFLTPMLHALHAGLPQATLDVLIRDPRQVPLLDNLPGIGRIHVQPRSLRALLALVFELRRQRYDLAIDPTGTSTSNRVALLLSGARQRLGFAGADQWLRLTHAAPPPRSRHQAEQAVELLVDGIEGIAFGQWPHLAIHPHASACREAEQRLLEALGRDDGGPVVGFFTRATGAKQLALDWWQAWLAAVQVQVPAARFLQVHPPGVPAPLQPDLPGVQIAALDVLAALLARLDVFVAADSGPMHLAAAAGVPTIGLFKDTAPEAYAPLGPRCCFVRKGELTPEFTAQVVASRLALMQANCDSEAAAP